MRTTQFDKLVKLSPYPINIDSTEYPYVGWFEFTNRGKMVYEDIDFKPSIGISKRITSEPERIATLVHELGHAQHYKRHCKCYQGDDRILREYHAMRFSLRFMLRYKLTKSLQCEIDNLSNRQHSNMYQIAIRQLQQNKIWQKCKNYLDTGIK